MNGLDFLCQEINREFNTIGSKANDAGIGQSVVGAKTELEKIREQVQNIEWQADTLYLHESLDATPTHYQFSTTGPDVLSM